MRVICITSGEKDDQVDELDHQFKQELEQERERLIENENVLEGCEGSRGEVGGNGDRSIKGKRVGE